MFASIFFFLFLFFLFLIIIGGSLLRGIINLLFGRREPRYSPTGQATSSAHSDTRTSHSQQSASSSKKREKIFDESEGEYVDFEEIKE